MKRPVTLCSTLLRRAVFPAGVIVLSAAPALPLTLEFPGPATPATSREENPASYRMPTGPWQAGAVPERLIEGALQQTAWRIDTPGLTTLAILNPLKAQLLADGWQILFECETRACGGFDFRYATEVLPEPEMHVDLGDFRYLAAEKDGGAQAITILASRSSAAGFVQVTRIGAKPPAPVTVTEGAPPANTQAAPPPHATGSIAERLETGGAFALDDLVFGSGASALQEGDYASLRELADYLKANPDRSVALVGHTDASGGLDANIDLSRKRAAAVRRVLIETYGAPAAQVVAEGVGYLSPRASNLTPEGRTQNRRVEVMLTSTR